MIDIFKTAGKPIARVHCKVATPQFTKEGFTMKYQEGTMHMSTLMFRSGQLWGHDVHFADRKAFTESLIEVYKVHYDTN